MTDSPVERYLDDLFVELRRTSPRDAGSLLSETESHLRDAVDEARAETYQNSLRTPPRRVTIAP